MLPKINALKQYLRTQAGTSFTSACVAVMWRIPPPNSSPTSTCPPFFGPWKLMTFSFAQVMRSVQSSIIYSIVYGASDPWAWNDQLWGQEVKGQRSRSQEAEVRFKGLAEALLWTFLVSWKILAPSPIWILRVPAVWTPSISERNGGIWA